MNPGHDFTSLLLDAKAIGARMPNRNAVAFRDLQGMIAEAARQARGRDAGPEMRGADPLADFNQAKMTQA
jgi:hypothetical protein